MFDRSIGLLASCALGASAFLLPPTVAIEDVEARPFFNNDGKDTRFTVPCPSCDFEYDPLYNITDNTANKLLMNLHIAEDNSGLQINDIFIFPQEKFRNDPFNSPTQLWLDQMPARTTEDEIERDDFPRVPLKVGMFGMVENMPVHTLGYTIHSVQIKISGLGKKSMTDLPMVFVQLLRSDDGQELIILSVDISPNEGIKEIISIGDSLPRLSELDSVPFERPHRPAGKPHRPECTLPGPLCAISRFIGSTFRSPHRRPCPGRKPLNFDGEHLPTHVRPHFGRPEKSADDALTKPDFATADSVPFGRPHHGHGRHGHHRHGFFHVVSRGILAVLIPIMAGITVGIIVSVLGLLFGRLLGYLWFTAFRGGRRGYTSVSAEEAFPDDGKIVLTNEPEQPLPPYEDAPAYEESPEQKPSA